jgi:putative inorganic carbon (hco3(-)) transporter
MADHLPARLAAWLQQSASLSLPDDQLASPAGAVDVPTATSTGMPIRGRIAVLWRSDLPERFLVPAVVATIPLEFTKIYFPFQIIEVSRLLMVVGLVILGVRALTGSGIALPRRRSLLALSTLVAYSLASAILTRSGSGLKNAAASIVYLGVAILVYNWTRSLRDQRRVWLTVLASGIVIGLLGSALRFAGLSIWNPDLASGYHRANSTFADPNIYARFLTFVEIGALVLTWEWSRARETRLSIVSGLASAFSLPFTFSRFGWLLASAMGIVSVLATRAKARAAALALILGLIAAAAILYDNSVATRSALLAHNLGVGGGSGGTASAGALDSRIPPPIVSLLNRMPIDSTRRYLTVAGIAMYSDHPLFGVGYGNFQRHLQTDYAAFKTSGFNTTLEHTTLIGIAAELGTVGLLLLLWALIEVGRETWLALRAGGRAPPLILAAMLCLVAILIDSQVAGRFLDEPYLWFFLGLFYSAIELRREVP